MSGQVRPVRSWLCLLALLLALAPARAYASVVRFALVVGANRGAADEQELRYAQRDAGRVREVLLALGGFLPENTILLDQPPSATVRRVLIELNERVRTEVSRPDTQAVLFVYYSGHADASALHLAADELALRELSGLVNGSAAQFRLLVLDACRSGALARLKGGRPVPAFAVGLSERLSSEGAVLLTSSAASEDAQESDALEGSFFTHFLVSGLLGAADEDTDGQVSVAEVYRYAYAHTLRATSRSAAGTQHPSFLYQLRGQGDLPLTFPRRHGPERAELLFPAGRSYLLFAGDGQGPVVAEVAREDRVRSLSVAPGRYFVRGRDPDALLEGSVQAVTGTRLDVASVKLERVEYARLARKGGHDRELAHGPQLAYRMHSAAFREASSCQGAMLGYTVELAQVTLSPRLGLCMQHFQNPQLSERGQELALELRVAHVWDLSARLSVNLGASAGAQLTLQQFQGAGATPARASLGAAIGVGPGALLMLGASVYVFTELSVVTFLLRRRDRKQEQLSALPLLSFSLGLGKYF